MIKYQLLCDQEHEFEGWFSNSASFNDQLAKGFVDCPVCGSDKVRRALMAPNLNSPKTRKMPDLPALPKAEDIAAEMSSGKQGVNTQEAAQSQNNSPLGDNPLAKLSPKDQAAVMGAAMTALRDMHKKVKKDFTNVGEKFAEEARKIHYGETKEKPIYGTTTQDERDELLDEGIVFHHLPDLPPEH
ncbi:MAG: DUF1178 family protein [Candidatus Puniceispirillaceae bacterium]